MKYLRKVHWSMWVALGCVLALFVLEGCATSIKNLSGKYEESSIAVREFAQISASDWLFGSGIIRGALDESMVPAWVFDELEKIDSWFLDEEGNELENVTLTSQQLGYTVGVRFRLAGPIIKSAIQQYSPRLLDVSEVVTVLSFLGI